MKKVILAFIAWGLAACPLHAGDMEKPVKVYILAGQSNAEGRMGREFVEQNYPELAVPRDDLWHYRPVVKVPGPYMGPNYGGFGVEFKAGHVLADAVDNDVIFITSAVGGTMLHTRWRPPSAVARAGGEVGDLYTRMIRQVHNVLANLDELYPRYRGQGAELAGLVWFQGENDCCAGTQVHYRDNLMDLIRDVRADLGVPDLPICLAKINDSCWGPPAIEIWAANDYAAHADKNVVAIHTRDLYSKYHYDPPSYVTIGDRIGKALLPFSRKPVHVGDREIRAAAKRFFARTVQGGTPDMSGLREGLVGYWKFDEEKGLAAESPIEGGAQGSARFDRKTGAPVRIKGKFAGAMKLTDGQRIEFPDYRDPLNANGEIENMSIAFWAKTPCDRGYFRIGKSKGRESDLEGTITDWYWSGWANMEGWDVRGWELAAFTATRRVGSSNITSCSATRGGFGGDGIDWHHFVAVYDGTEKRIRLYLDGVLDERVSTQKREPEQNKAAGHIVPSSAPLTIGGAPLNVPDFNYQAYDEVAIWSRPLTDEDVAKLYNGGAGAEILPANEYAALSIAELRDILKNSLDAEIRYQAVGALAGKGDEAIPLIVETIRDESPGVRYRAAQAMGETGKGMQPEALALLNDDDLHLRVMGAIALKHMGRKADVRVTLPALVKALDDEHFDVRMTAADALAVLGDWAEAAIPALLKAARDEEWWVRRQAYFALASIDTPGVRSALIDIATRERHAVLGWQDHGQYLEQVYADPALQETLARAGGKWLLKETGYINTFAARGKLGNGLRVLERCVEQKIPIPQEAAEDIRRVLADEESSVWPISEKDRKRLEAILDYMAESKGAK